MCALCVFFPRYCSVATLRVCFFNYNTVILLKTLLLQYYGAMTFSAHWHGFFFKCYVLWTLAFLFVPAAVGAFPCAV